MMAQSENENVVDVQNVHDILDKWMEYCRLKQSSHRVSAMRLHIFYFMLIVPAVFMSLTAAVMDGVWGTASLKVPIAVLSAATAACSTLLAIINPAALKEKHTTAAYAYGALYRDMEKDKLLNLHDTMDETALRGYIGRMDEADRQVPFTLM